MRANEFITESAANELKDQLPNLKKTDYDAIDELMQRISKKHKITGEKLHDMFVQKYKHTPDYWIKKYKKELDEETTILKVNEKDIMDEFVNWTKQILGIESDPKIHWSADTTQAQQGHHTGRHTEGSNEIWVYIKNRNLVDIMRTVFHELVHVRQSEKGKIKPNSSYPGSPIERQADELAGKYIKIFGAKHPEIFQ